MAGGGPVGGFGQGEAVGVVFDSDDAVERVAKVAAEGAAVEPGGVGVLDEAGLGTDGAGDADADARLAVELVLGRADELDESADRVVVDAGVWHAPAREHGTGGIERDDLEFGAAEIDADPETRHWSWSPGRFSVLLTRPRAGAQERLAIEARLSHRVRRMVEMVLDAKGLACPLPVLRANRALRGMAAGERLRLLTTDRASVADVRAFCRETGHELTAFSEEAGAFSFVIRRRSDERAGA